MIRALFLLLFASGTLVTVAQVNINQGLMAYYPFSGNANDVSGNNNNPIFNNAALTADRLGNPGNAYHFNGTNNYMQVPNSPTLNMTNQMSISLWVRATGFYTGPCYNNMMVMKGFNDNNPAGNYFLRFSDVYTGCTNPDITTERFYGPGIIAPLPLVQLNQWYSVVWTYDGTNARIYVNCELKATANASLSFTNARDLFMGHMEDPNFPYWLNGDLDEVRIYNRALNQQEVNFLGGCPVLSCNNWLGTPSDPSYVSVGDLDMTGNQLTIEANFNRTVPVDPALGFGFLVSKHSGPGNINYALWPNGCAITTVNGDRLITENCPAEINKTYHVAMVYDGATLKFYRNGFLHSQIAATGNLINNDFLTTIARNPIVGATPFYPFLGYMNEVRIWNVARTQNQIQANMNASLANPPTQTGLVAYYIFDNLLNKQGNPAWNGTINGSATVNATNTACNFVADTCLAACVPTFQKFYGGNKADLPYHIEANPDGTYVTSGATNSFGSGGYDGHIQKMDKNGNLLWSKTIGGTGDDHLHTIRPTTDGGYITGGISTSFGGSPTGVAWLVKTDGNGNVQWSRKYDDGNANGSVLWDVINTADGGYAISGVNRYAPGTANGMVIKTDNTGAVVWAKSFDSNSSDGSMSLLEDANSLIIISYQFGQSSSFYDGVIMKLNIANGSVIWARNYEMESKSNWPRELFKTANGYSFNCYQDVGFAITSPEQVVVNTDLNGNPLTLRKLTSSPTRFGYYIPTSDGGFVTTQGVLTDPNSDIHLVKVTAAGAVQWTRTFGGTGLQQAYDIAISSDGGYLLAGYNSTAPSINDSANLFMLKTDSLGNTGGCNTTTVTTTISTPGFIVNPSFVWNSVTNLSFPNAVITPVTANPNLFSTTLCSSTCTTDTIINNYTPVLSLDKCKNIITVEDGTAFNTGDTVLMIQMKGAVIDSTNAAAFGTITDYKNAGNYEFNYVKNRTGNNIELKNMITRQYDIPAGKVQLIRVPYYQNANFSSTLTCLPWDGNKGGVLVLNVLDTVNLNANIDVSGKGFRGGNSPNTGSTTLYCSNNNYFYAAGNLASAAKGESIAVIGNGIAWGKGSPANAGGSGNGHNSGGGGGANGTAGGFGGYQLLPCTGAPFDNRGIGGHPLIYNNAQNRVYMGGGGGSGHTDNAGGSNMEGGDGGGIIIIRSKVIKPNGFKISANGDNAPQCSSGSFSNCHDGSGGGGAGGTILIENNNYFSTTQIDAKGGKGGDLIIYNPPAAEKIGPGGGGSGGVIWFNSASNPANTSQALNFGPNGVIVPNANDPWGATAGQAGVSLYNLNIPVATVLFKPNIDSVRIKDSMTACKAFDFKGLGYTNTNPIATWQWNFGDAGTANTQNPSHLYATAGTYTVKLVVTDINGCKDSITKAVTAIQFAADAGNDTAVCAAPSVTLTLRASAGSSYSWTPAIYLNNPALQNPTATISSTTRFYVTITNSPATPNCTAIDSVLITLVPPPANMRYPTLTVAVNQVVQLQARNLGGNSYNWQPAVGLNNAFIINPVFSYNQTQEYRIFINTAVGCQVVDTQLVKINGKKGLYVPRAFSPNGDGTNDRLYPILIGIRELYYFRVYNRWGNLLFQTNSGNPASGWDGKYKGSLQPVETYTWVAEAIDVDGIIIKKSGNTVLLR